MRTLNEKLLRGLAAMILLSLAGCGGDDPASPTGDTTAPAAVTDLRVESAIGGVVTLAWTAPGDDGDAGTASEYDIRYADIPVTEGNWETCTQASAEPAPAEAGTEQSTIIDTGGGANFHFALKTADEESNWSSLSNVVIASTGGGFVIRQLTSEGSNGSPCLDDGFVVWIRFHSIEGDEIYIANLESSIPTPTRLTDNGGEKGHPNNHGSERIVWEHRIGHPDDWEIWLYDKYNIPRYSQFTDNDVPDQFADLSSAGSFAWLQGYIMYEEVHYWYEPGHSESVISSSCCPTSSWSNDAPSADDGAVVWRSYDRVGSEGAKAWFWDGALDNLTDTIEGNMAHDYSLHAGTIAYEYGGGGSTMIRYWDGTTVYEVGRGLDPSMYNGTIAYMDWDGHDWEVRYWDGTTVHDITDNDYLDTQACLYGSIIAWVGRPPGSTDQIFYVDLTE